MRRRPEGGPGGRPSRYSRPRMKQLRVAASVAILSCLAYEISQAQTSDTPTRPEVPDWAIPGSATHKQVPPPPDFHRATVHLKEAVGGFSVSDIGAPLAP